MTTFSFTVNDGKMPRPSGMWQMPCPTRRYGPSRVMSVPSSSTEPCRGRSRPDAIRNVVVFPAPFGPSNATTDESGTASDTSRSTVVSP